MGKKKIPLFPVFILILVVSTILTYDRTMVRRDYPVVESTPEVAPEYETAE